MFVMTANGKDEDSIPEPVLSSEIVYNGKIVKLARKQIRMNNGKTTVREVIEHPGSVAIVPLLDDRRIVLIRQFRLATGSFIWEIPAGTLEKDESPEACAKRELEEETGFQCGSLDPLFNCYLAPGYSTELMHLYLARDLKKTTQHIEEDEIITIHEVSPNEALQMIGRGDIRDSKTIGAISFLLATGKLGP